MDSHSIRTMRTIGPDQSAWVVLVFGAILSAAMVFGFPDDIGAKILAMAVFWCFSLISVRADLTHPFVWFGGTFLLYSISGPLLFHLGLHPNSVWGGMLIEELDFNFAMDLQYLAFVIVCAVIGPRRVALEPVLRDRRILALSGSVTPVLGAAMLVALIGVIEVLSQGFTQKIDIILYGSWATRLGFGLHMTATCVAVYLIKLFVEGKRPAAYTAIICFATIGVIIVTLIGERNFLFRFLVIALLVVHIAHRKISFSTFVSLAVVASLLIAVMGGLKMAAVSDEVFGPIAPSFEELVGLSGVQDNPSVVNDSTPVLYSKILLVMALGHEFMTAGNNLAMVVTRVPYDVPFQNGWTLINDVVRAVQPGFLVRQDANNTTFIYNRLFFPVNSERGGGQGFSFVGTGFLNFGIFGVILVMLAFGAAVRVAYRWAAKSPLGLAFLLGFIPVAMQAARGDLSGPISQSLKHVLLPLLAMMAISHFTARRTAAQEIASAG